jgi:hypothetical protein
MKKVSVLVFNDFQQKILTFNGNLPSLETNEIKTFDVAVKIVQELLSGDCCMMAPVLSNDEEEIWQVLIYSIDEDYWIEKCVSFKWLNDEEFLEQNIHPDFNNWKDKIYRKNLVLETSNKIVEERCEDVIKQLGERA